MESAWACITWTNEFPKGVEAAYVSYSLIVCAMLGSARSFNDHLDINLGRLLLLVCDFFAARTHICERTHELFTHRSCLTHNLECGVCVCSAATNEGFYSRRSAQCVLSPRCDCAAD